MQNRKENLRVKLYLKSETNSCSLLFSTGSQGSKNWRRARHHDAIFLMKPKRYKRKCDHVFLSAWLVASQMEAATREFSF